MVDKQSGQVEYAVLNFGGLFGVGGDNYPLPWGVLDYKVDRGGYVVDLDKDKLERAPRYSDAAEPNFDERYGREVHGHYGVNTPI